ncbi:uncharacterized protein LOC143936247 [Lithobates pipiens]
MSTQTKWIQVQEMLDIMSKSNMINHAEKSLSNETGLEARIEGLINHARQVIKDVWNVEGKSVELTDSSSETKEIERPDHVYFELSTNLMYLYSEFKRQYTQLESNIIESQSHLIEGECELTKELKEIKDKADYFEESIVTMVKYETEQLQKDIIRQDEYHQLKKEGKQLREKKRLLQETLIKTEQMQNNAMIMLDECHQSNKECKQLREKEIFLQENESPDESCRVIGCGNLKSCRVIGCGNLKSCQVICSGNLKEETNQLRSGQESLIKQPEGLKEQGKCMPQDNAQMFNPESIESDNTPISVSQPNIWELHNEKELEKETIFYPKPSVVQRGVKIEPPHEGMPNQFSLGSEKNTGTPKQDASEIINFLKDAVPVFKEEGSMHIIDHIEIYENALSVLGLNDDQSRSNFLPWVFETKLRPFCEDVKSLWGTAWQTIKNICHLGFVPHKNVNAARVDIHNITRTSDQSPTEVMAVLKGAVHLAEKEPSYNELGFEPMFFEAPPTHIKVDLAKDYKGGCSLESLVKESNNWYSIQQTGENNGRPESPIMKLVDEFYVSPQSLQPKTKRKRYADIVRREMLPSLPSRKPMSPPIRRGEQRPPFRGGVQRPPQESHPKDPDPRFRRNYRVYLQRVRFKPKGRHPHLYRCNWLRGPTRVNREKIQGKTPQNPQNNREQLRPRQLSQNQDNVSDGDMSDKIEPVVPRKYRNWVPRPNSDRKYRNWVPRPNSDQPVSNTETKIDKIMDILHGFIAIRNVNNTSSRGKSCGQPKGHRAF